MQSWEGRHVLVTGGTGFIGAHVVDDLLKRGHKVKLAVRNLEKAKRFLQDRPQNASQTTTSQIADFKEASSFIEAVEDVDGIIHVASVSSLSQCVA